MTKLDIAILTEELNPYSGSRVAIELSRHLARLGDHVTLYAYGQNQDQQIIKSLRKLKVSVVFLAKPQGLLSKVMPNKPLKNLLNKSDHQIAISAATLPFFLSAKLANIPVVRIYMGTQFNPYIENKLPDEPLNIFEKIINFWENMAIYLVEATSIILSDHIIAISLYCSKQAQKLYFRKPDIVIYLGGNHLPPTTNYPLPLRESERDSTNYPLPLRLLSVSRITPYKGFHRLIKTVNNFSNHLDLTIVGVPIKPKYWRYLKKISRKNIHFIENPQDSDLSNLYNACDWLVTADRNLFFGLPIVEAAFFGKPAIAFNYAAATEIIDNGQTGFIIASEQQLKRLLKALITNPKHLAKLGQEAHKKAIDQFLWEKVAQQYHDFLQKINKTL